MWDQLYFQDWDYAYFRDIELTESDNVFISGSIGDYTEPILENYVAVLISQNGDVLWEATHNLYGAGGYDGDALSGGGYIVTGSCTEVPGASTGLFLQKISQTGGIEWYQVYDHQSTREMGYGVAELPDGGFAICGQVNGTGELMGEAWILRTDENGDTLWTDIQGTHTVNYANGVEYDLINDWIVVCMYGRTEELINKGPHLLYYSLDGEYLFGTTYPELYPEQVRGFCRSADGGYAVLSRYSTGQSRGHLTHTDSHGNFLWWQMVPITALTENDNLGLGFAQIDGGYICCGWDGYGPWPGVIDHAVQDSTSTDDPYTKDGTLDRYDADGNSMWHVSNEVGVSNYFYSAVQLPEGGYMAAGTCGGDGYLVKYAPETGIEGVESFHPQVILDLAPNPFTSTLSVSYSLPEAMHVSLTVYDLSGRAVGELESGVMPEGEYTSTWDPGELPTGCYVVVLRNGEEMYSRNCVLVR